MKSGPIAVDASGGSADADPLEMSRSCLHRPAPAPKFGTGAIHEAQFDPLAAHSHLTEINHGGLTYVVVPHRSLGWRLPRGMHRRLVDGRGGP